MKTKPPFPKTKERNATPRLPLTPPKQHRLIIHRTGYFCDPQSSSPTLLERLPPLASKTLERDFLPFPKAEWITTGFLAKPRQPKTSSASCKKRKATRTSKDNSPSIDVSGTSQICSNKTTRTSSSCETSTTPSSIFRSRSKRGLKATPASPKMPLESCSTKSPKNSSSQQPPGSSANPPQSLFQRDQELLRQEEKERQRLYQRRLALNGFMLPVGKTSAISSPPNCISGPIPIGLSELNTGIIRSKHHLAIPTPVFGTLATNPDRNTKALSATNANSKATSSGTAPHTSAPTANDPPPDIVLRNARTNQDLLATLVLLELVVVMSLIFAYPPVD